MKNIRFFLFVLTIATLLISACGGVVTTPTDSTAGGKVEPIPVAFVGIVESIAGDQWVINGQTVTVSPDVIQDGPFNVGDQVKVEGTVNPDGSFSVARVEVPAPQDTSTLPQFGNDNSNDSNTNEANVNDDNGNDANTNDGNINDDNTNSVNTNDDNGNDDNSNDDGSNSNDDNGNDDDSGSGGNDNDGEDNDNDDDDDNSND